MGLFNRRSRKTDRADGSVEQPTLDDSVADEPATPAPASGVGFEPLPPEPEPDAAQPAAAEPQTDTVPPAEPTASAPTDAAEPDAVEPRAESAESAEQPEIEATVEFSAVPAPDPEPAEAATDWWGDAEDAEWFGRTKRSRAGAEARQPVSAELQQRLEEAGAERISIRRAGPGEAAEAAPALPQIPAQPETPETRAPTGPRVVAEPDPDDDRISFDQALSPKRNRGGTPAAEPEDGEPQSGGAQVISFANQKGGVAKTTTTLNLAVAFAESGHRVLVIDLDPQGNLTMSQGIDPDRVERSMYDVLVHHAPIADVIQHREIDVAVSSIDLAGAEIAMSTQIGRERSLEKAIKQVRGDYDFICIDTPPSLGLLTINALTASDKVIVPVQCEYLSMRGLVQLQNTLEMIRENLNPNVEIEGILPTMLDSRTVHAKEAIEILEENFGELVFKSRIRKAIKFAEAPVRGSSVLKYDPAGNAANCYRALAKEVLTDDAS